MTARALAVAALWSLTHPLNVAYRFAHATVIDGRVSPANGFSLPQLIAFAESLDSETLRQLAGRQQ